MIYRNAGGCPILIVCDGGGLLNYPRMYIRRHAMERAPTLVQRSFNLFSHSKRTKFGSANDRFTRHVHQIRHDRRFTKPSVCVMYPSHPPCNARRATAPPTQPPEPPRRYKGRCRPTAVQCAATWGSPCTRKPALVIIHRDRFTDGVILVAVRVRGDALNVATFHVRVWDLLSRPV